MKSNSFKITELILIFLITPISFTLNYSPILKLIIGFIGFAYVLYILLKVERISVKINTHINWKNFWKNTLLKLILIIIFTSIYVWFTSRSSFFSVVINKPKMWILILLFYSIFSVFPQELIYRTFFFKRYQNIIKNEKMFIFMNAILFSLAHLLFKNTLVLVLTFIGGLLFAFSYKKTESTLLVSIEHAIFGCWLFTVGMGSMLGFPS